MSFAELDDMRKRYEKSRNAERELSKAYIRLRVLIPGAFDTPIAPKPEQIWALAEEKLMALRKQAGLEHVPDGWPDNVSR